jgi:hypothetical protein
MINNQQPTSQELQQRQADDCLGCLGLSVCLGDDSDGEVRSFAVCWHGAMVLWRRCGAVVVLCLVGGVVRSVEHVGGAVAQRLPVRPSHGWLQLSSTSPLRSGAAGHYCNLNKMFKAWYTSSTPSTREQVLKGSLPSSESKKQFPDLVKKNLGGLDSVHACRLFVNGRTQQTIALLMELGKALETWTRKNLNDVRAAKHGESGELIVEQ